MFTNLSTLQKQFLKKLEKVKDLMSLELLEQKFFSRQSGAVTAAMKEINAIAAEKKKAYGEAVNELKESLRAALSEKRQVLEGERWQNLAQTEAIDVTQPWIQSSARGHLHPISLVQYDLEDFFTSMGFMVLDGPELESDFYNFEAVNIPPDHPARDMQDTFYIKDHPNAGSAKAASAAWVMRTHTSSVQVRAMEKYGSPLRAIVPGRCFRNEATDPRHEHTLYQLEGIVIDHGINFAHLKGVLEAVAGHLYGPETKIRLLPKFYPFVEPGVRGEVTCFLCHGLGCRVCKQSGWLEIFGAGMIHPNVLRAGKVDADKYTGFAFGFGLSRMVMLKYAIPDARLALGGDARFLQQF